MLATEEAQSLKSCVQSLLADEGFRPKRNEYDDIVFKVEGMEHFYEFDEQDPAYVRLLVPNFWTLDSQDELHASYIAASHACERCKGVKIFVVGDTAAWASVEFFIMDPQVLDAEQIARQIAMIRAGYEVFSQKMKDILEAVANAVAKSLCH